MGLDDLLISTGVDGLIKLVREKGKVEMSEAAHVLNMPTSSIEEWAHMLEGEGLIKIQYQLTHIYLVWSPLEGGEQDKKRTIVGEKKDRVMAKMETLSKSVEESKVELNTLQEQLMNVQVRTQNKLQKLAADLTQSQHLDTQVTQTLSQKQTALGQMKGDVGTLAKQLDEFTKALKNLPGQDGAPNAKEEMVKLAEAESHLETRLKTATKLFDGVQNEISGLQERLAQDHTLEDLGQMQKVLEDLQFARAEMEKTSSTILNETKMMEDEIASLGKRIKEVEARKSERFNPRKMREQADELAKSVEKEREELLGGLEKSLQTIRNQVQTYSQAQYQYQNISARIESLRSALNQSNTELDAMEKSVESATETYAKDLAEAHNDLIAEKNEYDQMASKAKQVEYILGHMQEIRAEGDNLALKLKGIIKEAQVYGLTAPAMAAGGKGGQGKQTGGGKADKGAVSPSASTSALPPELVQRIAITTQEEESFERKRQEMSLLVRKMWEEDRKPKGS